MARQQQGNPRVLEMAQQQQENLYGSWDYLTSEVIWQQQGNPKVLEMTRQQHGNL